MVNRFKKSNFLKRLKDFYIDQMIIYRRLLKNGIEIKLH